MAKTNTFFLIHNFNTLPNNLLEYCNNYMIYDASTDIKVKNELEQGDYTYRSIINTGHNITTYFSYFAEFYDQLPEVICLTKGNMIGRHCSKEYFDRVYQNQYFTYLYEEKHTRDHYQKKCLKKDDRIAFLATESQYLEKNTSWYANSPNHPHRYFTDLDDLLRFIYQDPIIPQYCLFSPGACYIVRKEQILKHSKAFYLNLNKIMSYGMNPSFPSEAHQVERILPMIFEMTNSEQKWMNDLDYFDVKLKERELIIQKQDEWNRKRLKCIRKYFRKSDSIII